MNKLIIACLFLFTPLSFGKNISAIATSSPQATEAGMRILKEGGSAIDAACAALFTLNVTQSYFIGIGGGGFANVNYKGQEEFLDFREEGSARANPKQFLDKKGKQIQDFSEKNTGPKSVGIPGLVKGCGYLQAKYGKISWKKVLEPAIEIAEKGYKISKNYEEEEAEQWSKISGFEGSKSIFGGASGTGLKEGEILKQPALAQTLREISETGYESFYSGKLAETWLEDAKAQKVPLIASDLKNYKAIPRKLIKFNFRNLEGVTSPLPSSAGLTVAAVLKFVDSYYKKSGEPKSFDDVKRYVVTIEALKYFYDLRDRYLADPKTTKLDTATFLDSKKEKDAFSEIEKNIDVRLKKIAASSKRTDSVQDKTYSSLSIKMKKDFGHTAHVSVVDSEGNVAAITSSVGEIYGSGITLPKTGFVLNSTMGDCDSDPRSPNAPRPTQRCRSNMSPTIFYALKDGQRVPVAIVGAAGGPIIPASIVQFVENYFIYNLDEDDSIKEARVLPGKDGIVTVEKSLSNSVKSKLRLAGYELKETDTIWALHQAVIRKNDKSNWTAVADPRYDGAGSTEEIP